MHTQKKNEIMPRIVPKQGLLFKERICSQRENFFFLLEQPYGEKGKVLYVNITKTYLYNLDPPPPPPPPPLKPHFYIVKLEFTGVYIIFLFLLKNIDCGTR